MKIITDENCTSYRQPGHPERPERISATLELLRAQKEIAIEWLTAPVASDGSILRAHTPEHVARLDVQEDFDPDTAWFPNIAERARISAGAAIEAMRCGRRGESVFSLIRPPGHHATGRKAMGFCYLNNIAIASLEAVATGVKKVAVFDFDVHHGNGTEAIFLNKPGTAFFSIHQFPCYPGTGARNRGENCFNYPVPPQTPRKEYRHILSSALEHLESFEPELVGVSAGFDAYARDPLAQETLEAEDFEWLGQQLRKTGFPLFSVLEGGYSDDLPQLILAYLRGVA